MKPLKGIRVVDFTTMHSGPLGTRLLADFGAEVIKIENTDTGEKGRTMEPLNENGQSGYFAYLNRGKKSIAIDLNSDDGKKIVADLLKTADVVTENFPAGVMEKLGFGYENIKEINPKLIYASVSGYGHKGPIGDRAALDVQIQSMSGMSSISGYPEQGPVRAGAQLSCHVGGTYLAIAIMIAIIAAEKTGEGQEIDISMVDSILSMIEGAPIEYLIDGTERERTGNSYPSIFPYDTFETNDGSVSIGVSTDRQWGIFCEALGLHELVEDPRYISNETRGQHYWTGLRDILQNRISQLSRTELEALMNENKIPCGIIRSVDEAMSSETVKERFMLIDVEDHTMGKVKMPGLGVKFDGKEEIIEGAPKHGENTKDYLVALGFTEEEIKNLQDLNIVKFA